MQDVQGIAEMVRKVGWGVLILEIEKARAREGLVPVRG